MKVLIALPITLAAVALAWSQTTSSHPKKSQIDGVWELVSGQPLPKGARDIKILSAGHVMFVAYDTETGKPLYTGGGTYMLNGSSYTEHMDFASDVIATGLVGKDQQFTVKFLASGDPACKPGRITRHPTEEWMRQMGRNAIDETSGYLRQHRYVIHDRDTKFCQEFRETLAAGGVKCLRLPPRSPNLNAFAERWVRSVKEECLSKLILFGEGSLRRALTQFQEHYLVERNLC